MICLYLQEGTQVCFGFFPSFLCFLTRESFPAVNSTSLGSSKPYDDIERQILVHIEKPKYNEHVWKGNV